MFEPRNSFEHIDKLTYEIGPRLAGTRRARVAADYINQKFGDYGLDTEIQSFNFVDRVLKRRVMVLILAAVFVISPILSPLIGLFLVAGGYALAYALPRVLPKKVDGNIIGRIRPEGKIERRILIGGHYDSANCVKDWNWIYLFKVALPAVLSGFFAISIFRFFISSTGWLVVWTCFAIPYLFVCALPFLIYENKVSPGANDNASGVSVLLELARVVSESGPENSELVFVAFGGEEQGLIGSKEFAKEVEEIDFFLNLDSLGSGEELALITGNGTFRKYSTSAELNSKLEERERLEKIWAPFSIHDHLPFLKKGTPSTTLSSIDSMEKGELDNFLEKLFDLSNVRTTPHQELHSLNDIPERIRLKNIEKSGNLVLDVIGVGKE